MKIIVRDAVKHYVKRNERCKDYIKRLRRWWLHRKWQRRFDRAWRIAVHKSKGYHELIDSCSPWYYFKNELDGLKDIYFDEELNRYVKYDGY